MTEHAVVIAGAGPTGLMLAGELALAGVDVAIVERRQSQVLEGQRAGGLHARTIEVLDQRGIAERFLAEGKTAQVTGYALNMLSIEDFPTRHPYGLGLWQNHIERILAGWVEEQGVQFYRAREVTGFAQDETGVSVALGDGTSLRAQYLVGCDGGRSVVRKAAGIEFPGWDPTVSCLIGEVDLAEEPAVGIRTDARGTHGLSKLEQGTVRVLITEHTVETGDPTLADFSAGLKSVYGTDFGLRGATWLSRFTDTTRQAAKYRERRVLLAGDAAHIHPPHGGQGLNIGVQDAVNLGWKLAQVIAGTSPDSLLDTYHAERHPIGARVLKHTMAQVALRRIVDDRSTALNDVFADILKMDEPRKRFAGMMSGLDVHYELGEGHPLVGRRMPDLDLVVDGGTRRVYSYLHRAWPLLLDLGDVASVDVSPWASRVQVVRARVEGEWQLPVLGVVPAPRGVLVRPDGYVAWVGEVSDPRLLDALTTWFGPR
ncbi:MAG TPA: FAD-dependent monooxygenase [Kofleriaceae bacterium]|nr:FAD-dependent monooxygenase [Kofleriaceae bacterium]